MKSSIIASIVAVVLVVGAIILTQGGGSARDALPGENVSIVDGVQIVELRAKGGYQPRRSVAQAGIPTVIRFDTKGTFDCSSIVRLPSLDITETLAPSGTTEIAIGEQPQGTFRGSCGMGMYPFEIEFE